MQDPLPENVEGSKRVAHTVEHRVNWSYVVLGLAVIALLIRFRPSGDNLDGDDGVGFNTQPSERRRSSRS